MEIRKSTGLLACAGLLVTALLSGCGGSSTTNVIPTTTQIFFAHGAIFGNNSTVMTMGYNGFGQLGINSLVSNPVATAVPNLGRMSGFSVGGDHTLAFSFTNLSSVYAWGSNYHGQIGGSVVTTGSTAYSPTPLRVPLHGQPGSITTGTVTSVAAGAFHSLAAVDGTVFAWGYNQFGQLGTGQALLADSTIPTQVTVDPLGLAILNNVAQVAAGGGHSLGLTKSDGITPGGNVYAWGLNNFGQLGSNPLNINNSDNPTPTLVSGLPVGKIMQIVAAGSNSYARDSDGHVWAWGYNNMGQLAKSPTDIAAVGNTPAVVGTPYSFTPVMVLDANGAPLVASKIAAGLDHVLALVPAGGGTVWAWGFNQLASLGNNTIISSPVPVQVLKAVGQPLTGVTDIEAYGNSSLARVGANPGAWWGWGDNGFGQLGFPVSNTTVGFQLLPVLVQGYP